MVLIHLYTKIAESIDQNKVSMDIVLDFIGYLFTIEPSSKLPIEDQIKATSKIKGTSKIFLSL